VRYQVLDVFTRVPFEGNPLAVFPDAKGLSAARMQAIARELNLSETVFVLPSERPECVARLKIFTPRKEMDFAGHPTIGTAFLLANGRKQFCVEENVGVIPIVVDDMIWLETPPISDGPTMDREKAAALVRLSPDDLMDATPQVLSAGNATLFIPVKSKTAVDRAELDSNQPVCVFVFAPTSEGAYSRMFAPSFGVPEDPATGSATGPLAAYMRRHGMAGDRFVSEQGTKMGRRSLLHVRRNAVGGHVTPVITAELHDAAL
jgi:trans-2,3-dihydro-3-hydroxyanthranilate isomerase